MGGRQLLASGVKIFDLNISYVLPLKWHDFRGIDEMKDYLTPLSQHAEILVVDGSPEAIFAEHREQWGDLCIHLRPHVDLRFSNGKVNGVITGLRQAGHEQVVIADDDVRYDSENLATIGKLLEIAELVLPQNYFSPLPWHAKWDTARILINRAFSHDYPGTLGVRRSFLLGWGGYDGDVLFENLELMRTVKAAGGAVVHVPDLFVQRLPPTPGQFWSQRIRQAYDNFAQPWRLMVFSTVLPTVAVFARTRPGVLLGLACGSIAVAETGRRRDSGRAVFQPASSLFAPVWILERSVCVWAAMGQRLLRGGVRYGDTVIRRAATPLNQLRRHFAGRRLARRAAVEFDRLM